MSFRFFGDAGQNVFISKMLRGPQRDAMLYWLFNVIAQNLHSTSFPRLLAHLRDSLRNFLFKQWHEALDSAQLDELYEVILSRFDLHEQVAQARDTFKADEKPKNPPVLRIRGLVQRKGDNNENDDWSKKISGTNISTFILL